MMGTPDYAATENLLREVLQPQTSQQATEKLQKLLKMNFVVPLMHQLSRNQDADIRQLAAVYLRSHIARGFGTLNQEQRAEVKQNLLISLVEDPSHSVRLGIAQVISALSQLIMVEWKGELLSFLNNCATSPNDSHREASLNVFAACIERASGCLRPHFSEFAAVFLRGTYNIIKSCASGLQDPSSVAVRFAALKGVAALVASAEEDEDFARIKSLTPALVTATREACVQNNERVLMHALELFDNLAESGQCLSSEDLPDLIRFMLSICDSLEISTGIKQQAFNFIYSIIEHKPQLIIRNNLVDVMLQVVVPLSMRPDEEIDSEETPAYCLASQCVDTLALYLPSSALFHKVIAAVGPFVESLDPWERRGALTLLGIMSEGCEDVMRNKLDGFVPCVLSAITSNFAVVQIAASICLGQMAQYLQPEISTYHKLIMPALLEALSSPAVKDAVKEKLCYALELFCDCLVVSEIESHLGQLMPVLLLLLSTTKSSEVRENCIGAIGSAAQASEEKFLVYAEAVYGILEEALSQTSTNMISLRARATACTGSVVQALPAEALQETRTRLCMRVLEGLESLDYYDLREASYRFLGCLAYTLKDDFAPLLNRSVPFAIATLLRTDALEFTESGATVDGTDILEGVDSDDDFEDEERQGGIRVRTGFLDEQEAAIDLLCNLFRNVSGASMSQWLKRSLECADVLYKYFHDEVRKTVPALLQSILLNVHHALLPEWAPRDTVSAGSPKSCTNRIISTSENRGWLPGVPTLFKLHDNTMQLWIEKVWPILSTMLIEDDGKEVVGDVARTLGELLEKMGPHLLEGSTPDGRDVEKTLMKGCMHIFSGEHVCQAAEDEVDEDEDSRAVEEHLFDGVSCLISGLAQTMGEKFVSSFCTLQGKLKRLANHPKSSAYRCIGIGCYADIFKTMGGSALPFVEPVIAPALAGVQQTNDVGLRRNAAYCLGTIAEFNRALPCVQSQLLNFLKELYPLAMAPCDGCKEDMLCVRDNAIASIGRIIRSALPNQISPDEAGFIFLKSLPLKADFEESESVLKTLLYLYENPELKQILKNNQLEFFRGLTAELVHGAINEQTKRVVLEILMAGLQTPESQRILYELSEQDQRVLKLLKSLAPN